jgi:uncharacterized protein (TIGR03067 family)
MWLHLTLGAMVLVLAGTAIASAADGGGAPASSSSIREMQRLKGIWIEVALEQGGKSAPAQEVSGRVLVIDRGMYALVRNKMLIARGYLMVDPDASPKTLDTIMTDGDRFQPPARWLYQLDGDRLRLHGNGMPGKARPSNFTSPPGSPFFTIEYRRQKQSD